jgi:serine/threonine protein phosphatase 1
VKLSTPHFKRLEKLPKGRRLVIGDIHGCAKTLKKLVERLEFSQDDQLFFLGDYIDRGPASLETVHYVWELIEKGYAVFPLRGNHEQLMLEENKNGAEALARYVKHYKSEGFTGKDGLLKKEYFDFFSSLPLYFDLGNCFVVHAGFNFQTEDPLKDPYAMLWIRQFKPNEDFLKGRFVVHGHTPEQLSFIKEDIAQRNSRICLDNGCVYYPMYHGMEKGYLLALDVDSMELTEQVCVDFE